jgi:hypothetical protein
LVLVLEPPLLHDAEVVQNLVPPVAQVKGVVTRGWAQGPSSRSPAWPRGQTGAMDTALPGPNTLKSWGKLVWPQSLPAEPLKEKFQHGAVPQVLQANPAMRPCIGFAYLSGDRDLLCSPGWPQPHDSSASTAKCTTTPNQSVSFFVRYWCLNQGLMLANSKCPSLRTSSFNVIL